MRNTTAQKKFQDTNDSSSWQLLLFSNILSFWLSIKDVLVEFKKNDFPSPWSLYPNNPANSGFLSALNPEKWMSIIACLSPIFVFMEIDSAWSAIKSFYYEKNKNFTKTLALTLKILKVAALLTINIIAWTCSAALFLKALPYILLAVTSATVFYSIVNICRHAYRAYKAETPEKRKAELWQIARYSLLLITNTLALASIVFLGLDGMNHIARFLDGTEAHPIAAVKSLGALYQVRALEYLFYAVAACVTFGAIHSLTKKATDVEGMQATLDFFKSPIESTKNFFGRKFSDLRKVISNRPYLIWLPLIAIPLEIISLVVNIPLRIIALPFQALAHALIKRKSKMVEGAKESGQPAKSTLEEPKVSCPKHGPSKETGVIRKPMEVRTTESSPVCSQGQIEQAISKNQHSFFQEVAVDQIPSNRQKDYDDLCKKVDARIEYLNRETNKSPKIKAKLHLLQNIRKKLGYIEANKTYDIQLFDGNTSITDLEKQAERISSQYYQSFWCGTGKTEKIAHAIEVFEKVHVKAAPAA